MAIYTFWNASLDEQKVKITLPSLTAKKIIIKSQGEKLAELIEPGDVMGRAQARFYCSKCSFDFNSGDYPAICSIDDCRYRRSLLKETSKMSIIQDSRGDLQKELGTLLPHPANLRNDETVGISRQRQSSWGGTHENNNSELGKNAHLLNNDS